MANLKEHERFSSKNFLIERNWSSFKLSLDKLKWKVGVFFVRIFLLFGFLGVMRTLSNLRPHGDLSLYLLPFILLAIPFSLIRSRDQNWERWVGVLFVMVFWGMIVWCALWYFLRYEWGYRFRWLFLATCLVGVLTYTTFKRRSARLYVVTQNLLFTVWIIGVAIVLGLLGVLVYFIGYQISPQPSTSTVLIGGTFVLFLVLTIIRVYWLDSARYRRADRVDHAKPSELVLLLEWFVPRSYSYFVILFLLILSEAMLFSTIHQTLHRPTWKRDRRPSIAAQRRQPPPRVASKPKVGVGGNTAAAVPKRAVPAKRATPQKGGVAPETRATSEMRHGRKVIVHQRIPSLTEWMLFASKPYVFPKNENGQEIDAPEWFKYLGRILLGLLFAILLTQQLNIWKQFYSLYQSLLGCVRKERRRGKSEELSRQVEESLAHMRALLNTHAHFWRHLIFNACTIAPRFWVRWMLVLDPSASFYEGLARFERAIVKHWERTLFATGLLIFLICAPFMYFTAISYKTLLYAFLPAFGGGLFIFLLRYIFDLQPPKLYQFWLWWLLLLHVLFSLLLFFLALISGSAQSVWRHLFWYASLSSIGVFPVLYIFGGERHREDEFRPRREAIQAKDSDVLVRRMLLQVFFGIEHRRWLLAMLTARIHPVRSSGSSLRLILPSLSIGVLDTIRLWVKAFGSFWEKTLSSFVRSMFSWLVLQIVGFAIVFLWHLILFHRLFPPEIMRAYKLAFVCLLGPGVAALLIYGALAWFVSRKEGVKPAHYKRSLAFVFTLLAMGAATTWLVLNAPFSLWQWFAFSALSFFLAFPWLGFFSLRHEHHEEGQEGSRTSEKPFAVQSTRLIKRLAAWLAGKEDDYLQNVYNSAKDWQHTDPRMREELIRGCAAFLEETQASLLTGRWYEEEGHAREAVYRYWLMDEPEDLEVRESIAEQWLYLVEQLLDTLGSLLHDILKTELFKQADEPPSVDLILDTIERILERCSFIHNLALKPKVEKHLAQTLVAIHLLMEEQLELWSMEEHPERRACAYRIIGLLGQQEGKSLLLNLLKEESAREEKEARLLPLIQAISLHPLMAGVLPRILSRVSEEPVLYDAARQAMLCSYLPTPIAVRYQRCKTLQKALLEETTHESPLPEEPASLLKRFRTPTSLFVAQRDLERRQRREAHLEAYFRQVSATYFELFAYLLVAFKERCRDADLSLQALHWDDVASLRGSIQELVEFDVPEEARQLGLLLQHLFRFEDAQRLQTLCRLQEQPETCQELLEKTFDELLQHLDDLPMLYWSLPLVETPQGTRDPQLSQRFEVLFRGVFPAFYESDGRSKAREYFPLGRAVRFHHPPQKPEIDFETNLWFLELLLSLTFAEELLVANPRRAQEARIRPAGLPRIHQLKELTLRWGRLIGPYAEEKERELAELFERCYTRLLLLEKLEQNEHHAVGGRGTVDFVYTYLKLLTFVERLEHQAHLRVLHLLYLGLLPSHDFLYLYEAQPHAQGELRWYQNVETREMEVVLAQEGGVLSGDAGESDVQDDALEELDIAQAALLRPEMM